MIPALRAWEKEISIKHKINTRNCKLWFWGYPREKTRVEGVCVLENGVSAISGRSYLTVINTSELSYMKSAP